MDQVFNKRFFIFRVTFAMILVVSDCAPPNRRQVLPPMPGYIPVYIQHGDAPPEDPYEYSQIFYSADKNIPPYLSVTSGELLAIENNIHVNDLLPSLEKDVQASNINTGGKDHVSTEAMPNKLLIEKVNSHDEIVFSQRDNISNIKLTKTSENPISITE